MKTKQIVEKLCSFGERQLDNEIRAREFLCSLLDENGIEYSFFSFKTDIPKFKDSYLEIDGKKIDCFGTGLISGVIENKFNIVSSIADSDDLLYTENINFNPYCDSISKATFYYKPSIAVNRDSISIISKAEKIKGVLNVEKVNHETKSILVGNMKNPEIIVFSHFDSIEQGAIDNASGTAVCMSLVLENKNLLDKVLFVFDSNEEISYDEPVYWGHGYREFEKAYLELLEFCKEILVVDCVGYCKTKFSKDSNLCFEAFPIDNIEKYLGKMSIISGDYEKLLEVYQSPIDSPDKITDEYLRETVKIIKEYLFLNF